MDRGAWGATFPGVTKSWTGVSDLTHMQYFIICVYYIGLSIHLWMDTGCFHFGGILSNSSIDMLVQISVQGLVFHSDNTILHFIFTPIVHKCSDFSISSPTFSRTQKIMEKPWVVSHWTIFLVSLSGSQTFPEDKKIMASLNICNYFFQLIVEEGFLISYYSLGLSIQVLISFLFSFALLFSSFHSHL